MEGLGVGAYQVLTPGEKFGDFQIMRCLSYDLLGSLYQVRMARSKGEHTLLVLPPIPETDEHFAERFRRSAETLCSLDHPNVVRFEEHEEIKGRQCLVGPALNAVNLADHLAAQVEGDEENEEQGDLLADQATGLPPEEVQRMVNQILDGLGYLHDQDVFHLNVNPLNILVTPEGELKLTGYGIMRIAGRPLFEALASAGIPPIAVGGQQLRINTVDILSPEMRSGESGDHRSDLYAVGITTYWLLTGSKPSAQYEPPSTKGEGIHRGWDVFVANCLAVDSEKRFRSVEEAKQQINDIENAKPVKGGRRQIGTTETTSLFKHLDHIPVPERFSKGDPAKARKIRLAVIGAVGVVLLFFVSRFFLSAFSGSDTPERREIERIAEGRTPRLTLAVSPLPAKVTFVEDQREFLLSKTDTQIGFDIKPGDYTIRVEAPQHAAARAKLIVENEEMLRRINLRPAWGTLEITAPAGGQVVAVNEKGKKFDLGTIPEPETAEGEAGEEAESAADEAEGVTVKPPMGSLVVTETLLQSDYELTVSLPGYAEATTAVALKSGDPVQTRVELEPLPPGLSIQAPVDNVDVMVDGQARGQAPLRLENLPIAETFSVTLLHPEYRPANREFTLGPGESAEWQADGLVYKQGELLFRPSVTAKPGDEPVRGIKVSLKTSRDVSLDIPELVEGEDTKVAEVPEGPVEITIEHEDYITATEEARMRDRLRIVVPVELKAKPAKVRIKPTPAGLSYRVAIDGEIVERQGESEVEVTPWESHTLVVGAANRTPDQTRVSLDAGEVFEWEPTLGRIPGPQKGQDYDVPYLKMPILWIRAGSFAMGSPNDEVSRMPEEGPRTQVRISRGFWMGQYEVTQRQYFMVMRKNPSRERGENLPVTNVSWRDAMRFCKILNESEAKGGRLPEGYEYRLPTEAEWEYAARAGTQTPFPWGRTADQSQGNFQGRYPRDFGSGTVDVAQDYGPRPVGSYQPNGFGLYDMIGNVQEWCYDFFASRLPGGSETDWRQTTERSSRVIRGGAFNSFAIRSRVAFRGDGLGAHLSTDSTGFRVVLAPRLP